MSTTKNTTTFPQTVEIPQPLEIHPSVSPLAAELLLKTAEVLAREPKRYNQSKSDPCGSACCIVGHMMAILGMKGRPEEHDARAFYGSIGMPYEQVEKIYFSLLWPASLNPKQSLRPTAQQGIARIEHFLRTGE